MLSEPNIFQHELQSTVGELGDQYCMYLNTDDLYDPELALIRSRIVGGTLLLWAVHMDPFVTIHPTGSSSFSVLILKIPDYQTSIHISLYLPTSGKDQDFITELTNLHICLGHLADLHPDAALFIRGDSNVNYNNKSRSALLSQLTATFSLSRVSLNHATYHHFTGGGAHDSEIDVLLYTDMPGVTEKMITILCKLDYPQILSHHDVIISQCCIPSRPKIIPVCDNLVSAPRLPNTRERIIWSAKGATEYCNLVMPALQQLRDTWLVPDSTVCMSIVLQLSNFIMTTGASMTNKVTSLSSHHSSRSLCTPRPIRIAKQRLRRAHRRFKRNRSESSKDFYNYELKSYKRTLRLFRLQQQTKVEERLLDILTSNPSSVYNFIRSYRNKNDGSQTRIEKLTVHDKIYHGAKVPDGFYDAMTSLKSCNTSALLAEPAIAEQLDTYSHISKLCVNSGSLPQLSYVEAARLLGRLKKNVNDYFSITALHYLHAGEEGILHFQALLNSVVREVDNASLTELNTAHGIIHYKGHKKDKTSERSYRCISTCPFLSKALDLYVRDLHQEQWNNVQASTQYQGPGSSHELASLLLTEVIQHSLHVARKPVFLLALDAQSAFDRCLRQILICELFKTGTNNEALKLVDNRLKSRCTIYEWDKQLMGPAPDMTGFEQGGINSSEYYKLYNNEQLETAQASGLGVDLGNVVISAIGQADDVILCSNDIDSLRLLVRLTESYCTKYRVKLVASKTKLLGYANPGQQHLIDHAKLINPVTVDGQLVPFVNEAEHVGILRNTAGNMPNIINRIAAHKSGLSFILSAGLARGKQGNPAASLRVHQVYGESKLFSGLASLSLNKSEIRIIDNYYQRIVMNLQRLHQNTPRSFVFLQAGCLPGEAILHRKQLTLFLMVCHLPHDPLHIHARHVLVAGKSSARSWFHQIRQLCLLYELDHPILLLDNPPPKTSFKSLIKERIITHWENILREEAASLPSLKYFVTENACLSSPHLIWTTATTTSHETRKATILSRMASGRFRSEYMARHWSGDVNGYCKADTCTEVVGNLEHLLLHCPALSSVRTRLWDMFFEQSVQYPALYTFLQKLEKSPPQSKLQFILDPTAFNEILEIWNLFGQSVINHIYYLTRTYAYYIYRQKQILLGFWSTDNLQSKKHSIPRHKNNPQANTNSYLVSGKPLAQPVVAGPVLTAPLVPASDGQEAESGAGDRRAQQATQPGLPRPARSASDGTMPAAVPSEVLQPTTTATQLTLSGATQACLVANTHLPRPRVSHQGCGGGTPASTATSPVTTFSVTKQTHAGQGDNGASHERRDQNILCMQYSAGGLPCAWYRGGQCGGGDCAGGSASGNSQNFNFPQLANSEQSV